LSQSSSCMPSSRTSPPSSRSSRPTNRSWRSDPAPPPLSNKHNTWVCQLNGVRGPAVLNGWFSRSGPRR
jgi:hypothetical protein